MVKLRAYAMVYIFITGPLSLWRLRTASLGQDQCGIQVIFLRYPFIDHSERKG